MDVVKHASLMICPLEPIDHIYADISFLDARPASAIPRQKISRPHRRTRLISQHQRPPASRAMQLLLSLANVPATRCELVSQGPLAGFHQKQSSVRARVAHSQGAHATAGLPRLRSLRVEVSVHANRHRTIMWIFPREAPFWLRSFATSIRYVLYHVVLWSLNGNYMLDPGLAAFLVPARDPWPLVARHILIGSFHAPTRQCLPLSTR